MIKNTRDYNAAECMVWMYANNPNKIDIYMPEDYPLHLISLVPICKLKFPAGWYYSNQTKTLNKENSEIKILIFMKE